MWGITQGGGFIMGGWAIFKVSLHSWQRDANPPIFWRPPYIAYPPFFQILYIPFPPNSLSPPTPTPTGLSVVLFLWINGWSSHVWCAILLNYNMDLHMSGLCTLVPEGPWCVFYVTRRQVYWGLTHVVVFYWYSDLISRTQTHTAHSGASRLTHSYKYIFTPPAICSQQLPLLNLMIKWIIHWCQKFIFQNVFSFQKLFTCKSHIPVD